MPLRLRLMRAPAREPLSMQRATEDAPPDEGFRRTTAGSCFRSSGGNAMTVLIAVATRHEATTEIAAAIARALEDGGRRRGGSRRGSGRSCAVLGGHHRQRGVQRPVARRGTAVPPRARRRTRTAANVALQQQSDLRVASQSSARLDARDRRRGRRETTVRTTRRLGPLGAPIAHIGLHLSAVVNDYQTDLYLPPHATTP